MGIDGHVLAGARHPWRGTPWRLLQLILLLALAVPAWTGTALAATATITTAYLPDGVVGVPYSTTLAASGDFAANSWSFGGTRPPGVSLVPGTATISGTPGLPGDYSASISVLDGDGHTVTKFLNLHIETGAVDPPTITSTTDNTSTVTGGTLITVKGTNFVDATRVLVGNTLASIGTRSATSLLITVPPGVDGATTLTVLNAGGTASVLFYYYVRPVLTSVAPDQGPVGGGTSVVITGTGFSGASGDVYQVNIGGHVSPHFTVDSDTQITATTPDGQLGAANISLTKPMKPNSFIQSDSLHDAFTYVPGPLQITTASLSTATPFQEYTATIAASGGEEPYVFSATGLPPGLTLLTSGSFDDAPTAAGSYSVDFKVTDNTGAEAHRTLTLNVTKRSNTASVIPPASSTTYGDPVPFDLRVTAPGGISPTGGTVHLNIDDDEAGQLVLNDDEGTLTIAVIAAGAHEAVAVYDGNSTLLASISAPVPFVVLPRPTTTQLFGSPEGEVDPGTPVTYTANVVASGGSETPAGSVQFMVDGNPSGAPVSLTNGSVDKVITLSGFATMTAKYLGDGNFVASTSDPLQQAVTVTPTATTTVLQVPSSPVDLNTGATATATVVGSGDGSPVTSGSVRFDYNGDDGTLGRIIALDASGTASVSLPTPRRGGATVTATYVPDADHLDSSDSKTFTVVAPVTVVVSSDLPVATEGQLVHFSAQVVAADDSSLVGHGHVNFYSDGLYIGSSEIALGGIATFNMSGLEPGRRAITATFTPTGTDYRGQPSNTLTQAIGRLTTVVTTITPDNPTVGSVVTLTATVSANILPTGSVDFLVDGDSIGSAMLDNTGVAHLQIDTLTRGAHTVVAHYEGNDTSLPADASPVDIDITTALLPMTLVASVSNDDSTFGDNLLFLADLTSNGTPRAGMTVQFLVSRNGEPFWEAAADTTDANGHGVSFPSRLFAGTYTVRAQAIASGDYAASNEVEFTLTIAKAPSTVVLTSSANPSTVGQPIMLTANVSDLFNVHGTVTFFDGATELGSATANSEVATLQVDTLALGPHDLTAAFDGNQNQLPQTSDVYQQVVEAPLTAPTTGPVSLDVAYGSSANAVPPDMGGGAAARLDLGDQPQHGTVDISGLAMTYAPNPTYTGPDSFTYTATNTAGTSTAATVTITVDPPSPMLLPAAALPSANLGATYSATIAPAAGGSGSYTYAVIGNLPPWLEFDSATHTFSGTPTGTGTFSLTVRATDTSTGDGPFTADQTYALSVVDGGTVTIRVATDGTDAVFGFTSPTPELNLALATVSGHGDSGAVPLPVGTYAITADDMSGAGFGLVGLSCSDSDSTTAIATRTASITLAAGEALTCTFTTVNSRQRTSSLIGDFLDTRAALLLANQPDAQRRIDRLNGGSGSGGDLGSAVMGYLPSIVEGTPLSVSTSLGAIDRLAGNAQPNRLDIWMEGTFALFDTNTASGTFNLATAGVDYLLNPDLLVGGFVQMDRLAQQSIGGIGWLAGPYATIKLGDHFYFDVLAGYGTSANTVKPLGTYEDGFNATRWLLDASLQGQWGVGDFTLSPRARLSYFNETTGAYTDSLGVDIPAVTTGLGELAVGSGISYRLDTGGDVVIDTGLRLDGVADLSSPAGAGLVVDSLHGRIEGSVNFTLGGGAKLGLAATYDGLGSGALQAAGAKLKLSAPLD